MAHIHEKIDFTATVLVVHKDSVLLRRHEKYHIWLGVGGHIELDEDANTAALREVKEEVGLDVTLVAPPHARPLPDNNRGSEYTELIPPYFLNIHNITDTHQHHDLLFFATSDTDTVVPENEDDQWLWLSRSEVEKHPEIDMRMKNYALAALDALAQTQ